MEGSAGCNEVTGTWIFVEEREARNIAFYSGLTNKLDPPLPKLLTLVHEGLQYQQWQQQSSCRCDVTTMSAAVTAAAAVNNNQPL